MSEADKMVTYACGLNYHEKCANELCECYCHPRHKSGRNGLRKSVDLVDLDDLRRAVELHSGYRDGSTKETAR